jgi:hypothetical protein
MPPKYGGKNQLIKPLDREDQQEASSFGGKVQLNKPRGKEEQVESSSLGDRDQLRMSGEREDQPESPSGGGKDQLIITQRIHPDSTGCAAKGVLGEATTATSDAVILREEAPPRWSEEHHLVDRLDRLVAAAGRADSTATPLLSALLATRPPPQLSAGFSSSTFSADKQPALFPEAGGPTAMRKRVKTSPPPPPFGVAARPTKVAHHPGVAELERLLARGAAASGSQKVKGMAAFGGPMGQGTAEKGGHTNSSDTLLDSGQREKSPHTRQPQTLTRTPTNQNQHARSSSLSSGISSNSSSSLSVNGCPSNVPSTIPSSSTSSTRTDKCSSSVITSTTTSSFSLTSGLVLAGTVLRPPTVPVSSTPSPPLSTAVMTASSPSPSRLRSRFRAVLCEIGQKVPQIGGNGGHHGVAPPAPDYPVRPPVMSASSAATNQVIK